MRTAKQIGRIGALAVAIGVGLAAAVPAPAAEQTERTALFVCGTTCPTPDDAIMDLVVDQFLSPIHPGETITSVPVTTPQEYWPLTGILRLIGFVTGDPIIFGPGGPAWPDVPLWKLSGLLDRTANQSVLAGADALEAAIDARPNTPLVVYGNSQGASVVNTVKDRLAERYPEGTQVPDITFVLASDPNVPNGGLATRFPNLYIPILDVTFGATRTDTPFETHSIIRQYDGAADLPLYPINLIADINALLGFLYLHTHPFDVSLTDDASPPIVTTDPSGRNTYYFFPTDDLPLFAPLRQLGVPEALIDIVEPFFRVIVEWGYDRSIPPWQPTPARLIPPLNPVQAAADLVNAVSEGATNAARLVGAAPAAPDPEPATTAAVVESMSRNQAAASDTDKPAATDTDKPGTTDTDKPSATDTDKPGTTDSDKPGSAASTGGAGSTSGGDSGGDDGSGSAGE